MKRDFIKCIRAFCLLIVTTTTFCVVFVNMQFNMTGYWLMPTTVSSSFESVKYFIRKINYTKQEVIIHNRRLVNVFKGVRGKDKLSSMVMQHSGNSSRIEYANSIEHNRKNRHVSVLWFNKPVWIDLDFANRVLQSECIYSNCKMSNDNAEIQSYTAIVFTLTNKLDAIPPIAAEERNSDQAWIFFGLESPINHKFINYRHNNWMHTMNWSMSYRFDSDIFFPYGMLEKKKEVPVRNYSAIYYLKTKQAAWLVSNCGAASKRDNFVSEMKRRGLEVDIFGVCSESLFHDRGDMIKLINKTYKFYLSFENSLCKDYITEKFFRYYNLDVILVTRGGADYDHALPNDTFINSAHFNSTRSLVKFLQQAGSSEKLYTDFLRRKDKYYASEMFSMATGYCSMCEKLNNLDENRKTYADHVNYIHEDTCWEPSDVPLIYSYSNMIKLYVILMFILSISLLSWYILRNRTHTRFRGHR